MTPRHDQQERLRALGLDASPAARRLRARIPRPAPEPAAGIPSAPYSVGAWPERDPHDRVPAPPEPDSTRTVRTPPPRDPPPWTGARLPHPPLSGAAPRRSSVTGPAGTAGADDPPLPRPVAADAEEGTTERLRPRGGRPGAPAPEARRSPDAARTGRPPGAPAADEPHRGAHTRAPARGGTRSAARPAHGWADARSPDPGDAAAHNGRRWNDRSGTNGPDDREEATHTAGRPWNRSAGTDPRPPHPAVGGKGRDAREAVARAGRRWDGSDGTDGTEAAREATHAGQRMEAGGAGLGHGGTTGAAHPVERDTGRGRRGRGEGGPAGRRTAAAAEEEGPRVPSGYTEFLPRRDGSLVERWARRWPPEATMSRRAVAALLVVALLAVAAVLFLRDRPTEAVAPEPVAHVLPAEATAPAAAADTDPEADLVVHVGGEVEDPGLYTLPPGSRVADAVEAAGGALPDADLDLLNLARSLVDGEQILVGLPQPEAAAPAPGTARGPLVNINRADEAELETLPRVGEVTAGRIVSYREAHGPFTSVDDLINVDRIGAKTLEEIRPHVTVG
ncbi:hypothetical protein SUDANB121_01722 [Nocardiopsis dassonvillei]|uniref:helix-hairpin-helix domain-containing protein n=1 Tax=Nocardiopsis dassonvillei TaxID=2014 RepID=UPI003F543DEB